MTIRLELLAILKRNTFTDETGFSRALQDELIEDLYDFYNKAIAQAADKREQEVLERVEQLDSYRSAVAWIAEPIAEAYRDEEYASRNHDFLNGISAGYSAAIQDVTAELRQGRAAEE